ncbi:MAG TPA: hypothetical protein VLT36_08980 [Candidatus Dormibacteraeota bacterium]|nr:hypothetical protein [Candidatus Dormibacteraeota bacterium]
MVNAEELQELRAALMNERLPTDLQQKLHYLTGDSLIHRFVAENSRLIGDCLMAAYDGRFRGSSQKCLERLLKVLAYVRKNDDVIPDWEVDGFVDDQQELRAALTEFHGVIQAFKSWRLRYQVPAMWNERVST